jgi:formate hydrogenlyase subunit 3/multisubunit Na+/H+ antiporter MnhD subunit
MGLRYNAPLSSEEHTLLKFLIVVLLIALAVSLFSGFYFLMADQGDKEKRGTVNSLGVRVTLAVSLMMVVVYGVATGQLGSQAPWEQPQPTPSQDSE